MRAEGLSLLGILPYTQSLDHQSAGPDSNCMLCAAWCRLHARDSLQATCWPHFCLLDSSDRLHNAASTS